MTSVLKPNPGFYDDGELADLAATLEDICDEIMRTSPGAPASIDDLRPDIAEIMVRLQRCATLDPALLKALVMRELEAGRSLAA